jgi:hypothetical protein
MNLDYLSSKKSPGENVVKRDHTNDQEVERRILLKLISKTCYTDVDWIQLDFLKA